MLEVKIITMTEEELQQCVQNAVVRALKEVGIQNASASPAVEDELVDSAEAARILGCSTRTIASYRARALWRVVYRGPHKAFYWRSEIEAFRDANTRPSRDTK